MTRTRLILGGTAAVTAAAVVLLGGTFGGSSVARQGTPAADSAASQLVAGSFAGDTAAYTERLERRVVGRPKDSEALTLLGLAYQQRARETGDPSFYPRSAEALQRALRLDRRNHLALTGLAALAASRHRFAESRAIAERARRLSPRSAGVYGTLGDALVELGRYDEAFAAFDRMVALRPSLASYARVSYARELLGDTSGAIAAMQFAVDAAAAGGENAAWTLVQLGNLYFDTGRFGAAQRAYRQALFRFPGFVHARAGLARVAAARGRYVRAAVLYRGTVESLPLPQYALALGDVLAAAGRTSEAREAYGVVDVIQRLFRANGVRTETETALFDLDHDRNVATALTRAREAERLWPSIYTQDVLAWALYKNGRCEQARRFSKAALRLGTKDALKIFHRGMIELCLGNSAAGRRFIARALEINPHFSVLYEPVAREALR
jgi:tetratricopeptide (TPR) repeat protein